MIISDEALSYDEWLADNTRRNILAIQLSEQNKQHKQNKMNIAKNKLCVGNKCLSRYSVVRKVPQSLRGGPDLILCRSCFREEMRYRRKLNERSKIKLPIFKWEDLEIVGKGK